MRARKNDESFSACFAMFIQFAVASLDLPKQTSEVKVQSQLCGYGLYLEGVGCCTEITDADQLIRVD